MNCRDNSKCPITYSLDTIGDKWSLLVIRDMVFMGKKYYREFINSEEGISTNILADRLQKLEENGVISKVRDENNKKQFVYGLTDKGYDLVPVLLELIQWAAKHDPDTGACVDEIAKMKANRDQYIEDLRSRQS
jgi:DNA-binding HxlR family transcriptional regulator